MSVIGRFKQIGDFYRAHQMTVDGILTALLFLYCTALIILGAEVIGVVILSVIWCFILVLTDSLLLCLTPLLLTCVFMTKCVDSFDTIMSCMGFAIPVVLALVIHFYRFHRSCKIGLSFHGLCAVSFALLLGGFGTISPTEYLDPITLYYTLGLGIGMLAVYVIFAPYVKYEGKKTPILFVCLYLMGMMCLVSVVCAYMKINMTEGNTEIYPYLGFRGYYMERNEISTILMITLPIPCYFVRRCRWHILSLFAMYMGLLLSGSRGGLILGTLEFIMILIVMAIVDRRSRWLYIGTLAVLLLLWLFAFKPLLIRLQIIPKPFYREQGDGSWLMGLFERIRNSDEARIKMLRVMPDEFSSNPLFGTGIGYTGRRSFYGPPKGCMHWYHMWLPQVIGSLGIVGIIAYFSNLFLRIYIVLKHRSFYSVIVGLSYVGLFLMSQVNPGEFCPMPFAMIPVLLFASMDQDISKKKASSSKA